MEKADEEEAAAVGGRSIGNVEGEEDEGKEEEEDDEEDGVGVTRYGDERVWVWASVGACA